jgi:broad specificity phosphatase PhoE
MLTILLIRHANCDHVGRRIAGRASGVHLNAAGRLEAAILAEALAQSSATAHQEHLEAIYTSPVERAVETAEILAARLGVPVRPALGLIELDFGEWTGRSLEELDTDTWWRQWNEQREATRIPGGELMAEGVNRAMAELDRLGCDHPNGTVAAVSHGDIIRGVLLRYLGIGLDHVHRLEVSPASVSVVRGGQVIAVNWQPGGPLAHA